MHCPSISVQAEMRSTRHSEGGSRQRGPALLPARPLALSSWALLRLGWSSWSWVVCVCCGGWGGGTQGQRQERPDTPGSRAVFKVGSVI
eukprot:scaffold41104_cov228-Skeletonema_dohrnii-CCMP3373.AAC.2